MMTDEQEALRLFSEARDAYFFLDNAWQIARAEDWDETERLYRVSSRAWKRTLRRGQVLGNIRQAAALSSLALAPGRAEQNKTGGE